MVTRKGVKRRPRRSRRNDDASLLRGDTDTVSTRRFPFGAPRERTSRCFAFVLACAGLLALTLPSPTSAHFTQQMYTFNASDCLNWSDPVTAIFYGNADVGRTMNHIVFHTGWNWGGGADQYFDDHGECDNLLDQRASGGALANRTHIRIWAQADYDSAFGWTMSGTPHWEDDACGYFGPHAVIPGVDGAWSGFDEGRARVYSAMAPGHYTWTENWGNTAWMLQCNEQFAASNGTVRYFWIPYETH
jgi:hypothetical protein